MQVPPILPSPRLARALAVARVDGWSVVVVGSATLLWLLFRRDFALATMAGVVVLAGLAELHGRRRLLRGAPDGRRWLMGAQLGLLAVLWGYAWWRWTHFDFHALWSQLPELYRQMITAQLAAQGLDPDADRVGLLYLTNQLVALALALAALLYQGGLVLYYQRHALLASSSSAK